MRTVLSALLGALISVIAYYVASKWFAPPPEPTVPAVADATADITDDVPETPPVADGDEEPADGDEEPDDDVLTPDPFEIVPPATDPPPATDTPATDPPDIEPPFADGMCCTDCTQLDELACGEHSDKCLWAPFLEKCVALEPVCTTGDLAHADACEAVAGCQWTGDACTRALCTDLSSAQCGSNPACFVSACLPAA